MKLFLLTALTMLAFAANSLLNRAGLAEEVIGPANFANIRLLSGAVVLLLLLSLRDRNFPRFSKPNWFAVLGLSAYMLGFSYAYMSLDAGVGALLLFGSVQITMFAGSILGGDRPALIQWAGMMLSMSGLVLLFWPSDLGIFNPNAYMLMIVAAVGWGIYSLIGRTVKDPLHSTTWNFVYSLPLAILVLFLIPDEQSISGYGVLLAVTSGAITSGLGYALWYAVLPKLGATTGALSQLSVPIIALALGVLILGEELDLKGVIASMLVLGGIATGILGVSLFKSRT